MLNHCSSDCRELQVFCSVRIIGKKIDIRATENSNKVFYLIIPECFEPPNRILRATIPENESQEPVIIVDFVLTNYSLEQCLQRQLTPRLSGSGLNKHCSSKLGVIKQNQSGSVPPELWLCHTIIIIYHNNRIVAHVRKVYSPETFYIS